MSAHLKEKYGAKRDEKNIEQNSGEAQKSLQRFTLFQMYPDRKCLMAETCASFVRV